ncbi:MAG: hypothetical protein QOK37_811 [Thermoanaerobaculia bacterium]|nr:hypothetical protein [Thermoanaerobaculia bacterium]
MDRLQDAAQLLRSDQYGIATLRASNEDGLVIVDHSIDKLFELGTSLRVGSFDRHQRLLKRAYFPTAHRSSRTGTSSSTVTRMLCGTLIPKSGMWILKLLLA